VGSELLPPTLITMTPRALAAYTLPQPAARPNAASPAAGEPDEDGIAPPDAPDGLLTVPLLSSLQRIQDAFSAQLESLLEPHSAAHDEAKDKLSVKPAPNADHEELSLERFMSLYDGKESYELTPVEALHSRLSQLRALQSALCSVDQVQDVSECKKRMQTILLHCHDAHVEILRRLDSVRLSSAQHWTVARYVHALVTQMQKEYAQLEQKLKLMTDLQSLVDQKLHTLRTRIHQSLLGESDAEIEFHQTLRTIQHGSQDLKKDVAEVEDLVEKLQSDDEPSEAIPIGEKDTIKTRLSATSIETDSLRDRLSGVMERLSVVKEHLRIQKLANQ
jgi:hypothetical protein